MREFLRAQWGLLFLTSASKVGGSTISPACSCLSCWLSFLLLFDLLSAVKATCRTGMQCEGGVSDSCSCVHLWLFLSLCWRCPSVLGLGGNVVGQMNHSCPLLFFVSSLVSVWSVCKFEMLMLYHQEFMGTNGHGTMWSQGTLELLALF